AALDIRQLAVDVASRVAIGDVATPVVELLATGQPELELRPTLRGEIEAERHDRLALRLRPAEELVDLRSPQQELPRPLRLVVVPIGLLERGDVRADEPRLVALDPRVGVRQVDLAGSDRLDLRPGQDDPGLERVIDRELMSRPPIEGNRLFVSHRMILRHLRQRRMHRVAYRADLRSSRREVEVASLRSPRSAPMGVPARQPETQESRPEGRLSKAFHPQGCPTRRASPARWCSYYCRSLHITSFRSDQPYRNVISRARILLSWPATRGTARTDQAAGRSAGSADESFVSTSTALSSAGSLFGPTSAGVVTATSGMIPTWWIQRLFGVSHFAIVSFSAEPSWSWIHCWTVPLPNDVSPTIVARFVSWSAPATISLADADPLSTRATSLIDGSVAIPSPVASVSVVVPSASRSQKIGPDAMNS